MWHYALTKGQTEQLEAIQKRAIHIILNFSRGIMMLTAANLTNLASRREEISQKNFLHITELTSCLHHLLPEPRELSVISRLRTYQIDPNVTAALSTMC